MTAAVCSPSNPQCGLQQLNMHSVDIDSDFFATTHAVEVSQLPPSRSDLSSVASFPLFTEKGEQITFGSLWKQDGSRSKRSLIIFVRHFFCGNCQEYLRTLSESIHMKELLSLSEPTTISVIGCGQPDLIDFYRQTTGCTFDIYAEPTRELYVRLGMARTMAPGEKKPDYVRKSMFGIITSGLTQGFTAGRNALKGGDFWQVGGEFLIENDSVTQCHRMTTTRDHAEIPQLRRWLGIAGADDDSSADEAAATAAADTHRGHARKRSLLVEMGKNVRRSISMSRSSSTATSGRKASESSLKGVEGMEEVKE